MLRVLQHNCQKDGEVLTALIEMAVERGTDMVLIQEPRHSSSTGIHLWTAGRVMTARWTILEWTVSTEDLLGTVKETCRCSPWDDQDNRGESCE
jgi:hypothetical protein